MSYESFRDLQGVCVQKGISFSATWNAGTQDGKIEISYLNGIDSDEFQRLVELSEFSGVKISENFEEERGIRVRFQ